ncbi:MAG TPA: metallophosphoesterase [Cyclobacteriaceae bacterium]|jgi:predicted phosphodiesterase|nr:metallophosphoesterase [Cyclobacteriaceae bacterium]
MESNNQKKFIGLSRSVFVNRYKTDIAKRNKAKGVRALEKPKFSLADFLNEKIWKWIEHSLRHLLGSKHEFQVYKNGGVYPLQSNNTSGKVTISIVADWATDTEESVAVANKIKSLSPDYTIHLGDTYYTGESDEINDNFLKPGAPWHRGNRGSFALMGNHEMYSMAKAYYRDLLPSMGPFENGKYSGQGASYFCLTTENWIIIGLDTGYNSVSFPYVWNSFKSNCQLPDPLMEWLKKTVNLAEEKRGIILLSHHQYVSAFCGEKNYTKPAEQLAQLIGTDKKVIWIWGHEHRFAIYGKYQSSKGISVYGRCIGHGGMPVELHAMTLDGIKLPGVNLLGYDNRIRKQLGGVDVGWNGFAHLTLEKENLTISYYDTNGLLMEEKWKSNANGEIACNDITLSESGKQMKFLKSAEDLINS